MLWATQVRQCVLMYWMRMCRWVKPTFVCLGLSGCAAYHAAPLNLTSPLKNSLAGLEHILPDGQHIALAPPLPLTSVAALAVLNDPDLIAARTQSGVGKADLLTAGLLPDPSITGGFAALISGPGSIPAITGGFTEDLSALITYRVNVAGAKAGLAAINAGILWQEWQVAGQAEALCIAIDADNKTIASLRADDTMLSQVNAATQSQVNAANLTLAASSASLAALAATQTALNTAIQSRDQDRDQLDALLGLHPGIEIPVILAPPAAIPAGAVAQAIGTLAQRRPDLIALRYGYTQADAKLRAAILSQFLPISLGGTAGRDTSNVWSAGPQLTLNLPLFNRNQGGIAAANAARTQLAAQFAASLATATAAAEALQARIGVLQVQSRIADAQAQTAASIAAQAQTAFANGALDALSAVNLQTAAGDRQREAVALHAQLLTASLSLHTMLGIGLPPIAQPALEPHS
jgi:outer membrane protein TolC